MDALYFAYGSNMHPERMSGRVAAARPLGVARLRGMRLVCNKRGRDGSAKANLTPAQRALVWGVLWQLPDAAWPRLDAVEDGYERVAVEVECRGRLVRAETYVSGRLIEDPVPRADYKRWLTDGARAHGLPPAYVAFLVCLPSC